MPWAFPGGKGSIYMFESIRIDTMDKRILVIAVFLLIAVGLVIPMAFAVKGTKVKPVCNDKIDNDGDGYTDFPSDPGCSSKQDNSELDPNVECDDGADNDGDSDIDYNDAGCSGPTDDDETNCGDSVCEGGETQESCPEDCGNPDSCDDTDGGNYPFVFGTTSGYYNGEPYSNDDYCVDSSNIMEYYCSGDYEQSQQQGCGTDGYVGSNYCINDSVYRDYRDYFCSSGECDYTDTPTLQEECEYGCTNGTCDSPPDSCNDTDGGIIISIQGMVSGYESGSPYNYTDYCANTSTIIEYFCSGVYWNFYPLTCMNQTSCSNGACV